MTFRSSLLAAELFFYDCLKFSMPELKQIKCTKKHKLEVKLMTITREICGNSKLSFFFFFLPVIQNPSHLGLRQVINFTVEANELLSATT